MADACKRGWTQPESSEDEWSTVDPVESLTSEAPEGDLKKSNIILKDVWASTDSDLDDSVAVPGEMRDAYQWGKVRIDFVKYASLKISFEKAVGCGNGAVG